MVSPVICGCSVSTNYVYFLFVEYPGLPVMINLHMLQSLFSFVYFRVSSIDVCDFL